MVQGGCQSFCSWKSKDCGLSPQGLRGPGPRRFERSITTVPQRASAGRDGPKRSALPAAKPALRTTKVFALERLWPRSVSHSAPHTSVPSNRCGREARSAQHGCVAFEPCEREATCSAPQTWLALEPWEREADPAPRHTVCNRRTVVTRSGGSAPTELCDPRTV
jgi:hypothetical protein